jgi:hypothetical protein
MRVKVFADPLADAASTGACFPFSISLSTSGSMLRGDPGVEHSHNEQDADVDSRNPCSPAGIIGGSARCGHQHRRQVPHDSSRRGHQPGPKARQRRLTQRVRLDAAPGLQGVRELHDQDAVLGNEASQSDEPDLRIEVVPRSRKRNTSAPDTARDTVRSACSGPVLLQDKIVARFAHTIYPYSLKLYLAINTS